MNNGDLTNALHHFEKATVYDNEHGLIFAAIFNLMGFGMIGRNPIKAFNYFTRAALEYQNNIAQYMIGMIYSEGDDGVDKSFKLTLVWLTLAANNGWKNSVLQLAHSYRMGMHGKKDYNKALQFYEQVIKKDDTTNRQISDEDLYLFGNPNFVVDLSHISTKLVENVKKATDAGPVSPVLFAKKICLSSDQDEKKQFYHLVFWDTMIIKKKRLLAFAYYGIAGLHLGSDNTNPVFNYEKGVHWLKKSGEHGDINACSTLGDIYELGVIKRKNYAKAIQWYSKAKELGGGISLLLKIADICCNRHDMKYDYKLALTCFLEYNEIMNDSEIDFNIALIYETGGYGVVQDKPKAKDIYKKLAFNGHAKAAEKLEILNKAEL